MLLAQAGQTVTQTVTRTVTETVPSITVEPSGGPSSDTILAVAALTAVAAIAAAIIAAWSAARRTDKELANAIERQQAEIAAGRQDSDRTILRAEIAALLSAAAELDRSLLDVAFAVRACASAPTDTEQQRAFRAARLEMAHLENAMIQRRLDLVVHVGSTHPVYLAVGEFLASVDTFSNAAMALDPDSLTTDNWETLDALYDEVMTTDIRTAGHEAARLDLGDT